MNLLFGEVHYQGIGENEWKHIGLIHKSVNTFIP